MTKIISIVTCIMAFLEVVHLFFKEKHDILKFNRCVLADVYQPSSLGETTPDTQVKHMNLRLCVL